MSTTKELWQQLVQHGQLCHSSVSEWHALAGSRREQLFREAQATPPLTYSPVSLENRRLGWWMAGIIGVVLLVAVYIDVLKNKKLS